MTSECSCAGWENIREENTPGGVSIGALFVEEAWMFAEHSLPGSSFPPLLSSSEWRDAFGLVKWKSPSHLVTLLTNRFGIDYTLRCYQSHWSQYFDSDQICGTLSKTRTTSIRIPIPWTMFPPPARCGFPSRNGFVADPFACEKTALPLCDPHTHLTRWIWAARKHGVDVIIDIHVLPGQTGPARVPLSWVTAVALMTTSERDAWVTAYSHIVRNVVNYIYNLPPHLKRIIKGLQPSNLGMHMDSRSFANPQFPGRHAIVATARKMSNIALEEILSQKSKSESPYLIAAYINIENAMLPHEVVDYLNSASDWLESMGVAARDVLVRARHLFALEYNTLFRTPTAHEMEAWVLKALEQPSHIRWKQCCIEWSAAPPPSAVFRGEISTHDASLQKEWHTVVYTGFLAAFAKLGIDNYFWTWDLPDCCPRPAPSSLNRSSWSFSCILKSLSKHNMEVPS